MATHNFEKATSASNAEAAGVPAERSFWYRHSVKTEAFASRDADLIVAVSPEDGRRFAEVYGANPERIVVVPNAADTEHYAPAGKDEKQALKVKHQLPDRPTVVFLASKPSPPHTAALNWVRRAAAAIPEFTFLVVGGLVPKSDSADNFIATGIVEDPAEFLKAADMAICPVEFGGGTKIKTLECVSVGLPTVVFAEAIHGTTLQSPDHVVLCTPDENEIVGALRRIGSDLDASTRMGHAGREVIVQHYDWKASASILEDALVELVEKRAAGRIARET
jgi:glycosyltransferase involved in cell wall biosynthesis